MYLDQQTSYEAVAKFAKGANVLDCFSFLGGFGLPDHLARFVEQLAFGEMFEDKTLQVAGAGGQDRQRAERWETGSAPRR